MEGLEFIRRVLIVGHGSIGKRHLRLARTLLPTADIRVLIHQKGELIPEFADGCFYSLEEAISFTPQIAVIANPAAFHLEVAKPLAKAGVHLLVEKPLSATIDDITLLIDICREVGVTLAVGYNLRYLTSLQRFRDLLHQNAIGRVLSVRCEIGQFLPSWRRDMDYRKSVSARKELGGGALLELSHEVDYLCWIFGSIEWVIASLSRQSTLEIDVEDTAHLVVGFVPEADGRRLIGTVNLDFIRHDTVRNCTAIGEESSLRWNGLDGSVERFDNQANKWQELFCHQQQRDDSFLEEWKNFLECVYLHKSPLVVGEDGLRVLQIIEAARKASVLGVKVEVAKEQTRGKFKT